MQLLESGRSEIAKQRWSAEDFKLQRDTIATLVYTSGTSGLPKAAALSHGNILYQVESFPTLVTVRMDRSHILLFSHPVVACSCCAANKFHLLTVLLFFCAGYRSSLVLLAIRIVTVLCLYAWLSLHAVSPIPCILLFSRSVHLHWTV